jgi:hypothetical protein
MILVTGGADFPSSNFMLDRPAAAPTRDESVVSLAAESHAHRSAHDLGAFIGHARLIITQVAARPGHGGRDAINARKWVARHHTGLG